MTKIYIDWHTHTKYSDGLDDPETVVRNSKIKGIQSLAITDHDTLEGYFQAQEEARKWRIDLIPGVEVSTEIYHILGIGIDPYDLKFNSFLKRVRNIQEKVCSQRIEILNKNDIPITLEKIKKYFPHPSQRLGKYNIFMSMMLDEECLGVLNEKGYFMTPNDFGKILGNNGIVGKIPTLYYVTSKEAINAIQDAKGIAIVAHPFKQASSPKDLDRLLEEGLDGVEIQPNYEKDNKEYLEYALQRNLKITYGSDYHGSGFTRPLLSRNTNGFDNRIDLNDFFKEKNR